MGGAGGAGVGGVVAGGDFLADEVAFGRALGEDLRGLCIPGDALVFEPRVEHVEHARAAPPLGQRRLVILLQRPELRVGVLTRSGCAFEQQLELHECLARRGDERRARLFLPFLPSGEQVVRHILDGAAAVAPRTEVVHDLQQAGQRGGPHAHDAHGKEGEGVDGIEPRI